MKEYPLSYLPNEEGFEFIPIYKDEIDRKKKGVVKKTKEGLHYIDDYSLIKSWKRYYGEYET